MESLQLIWTMTNPTTYEIGRRDSHLMRNRTPTIYSETQSTAPRRQTMLGDLTMKAVNVSPDRARRP